MDERGSEELRGRFISIEGLDGAGKSTAIEGLRRRFGEIVVLREPGGTALGEVLRAVLKGLPLPTSSRISIGAGAETFLSRATDRNPTLLAFVSALRDGTTDGRFTGHLDAEDELLLFNAARAQLVEERIVPALEAGATVVADRFLDSTEAYQGHARGLDVERVRAECRSATGGLLPDLTLYLRISPQTRLERIGERGAADRIESSGDEFFARAASGFDVLAAREPERVEVVDAEQPVESVADAVADVLARRFA